MDNKKKVKALRSLRWIFFVILLMIIEAVMITRYESGQNHSEMTSTAQAGSVPDGIGPGTEDVPDGQDLNAAGDIPDPEGEAFLDERSWVLEHASLFPEGKAEAAMENPGLAHFMYRLGNRDIRNEEEAILSEEEVSGEMPFLYQWDPRWGFHPYGENNIGFAGCGPTCLSMVLAYFNQDATVTPAVLADYAMENDYYVKGAGTSWSFMVDAAEDFGVSARQIYDTQIMEELSEGHPVIVSVRKGHFTDGGHFLVLAGIEDGKVCVHDPNNLENSRKLWSFQTICEEIKAAWAYGGEGTESMTLISE